MLLPNLENAIIEKEKLVHYLLNSEHNYGGAKARLLTLFGYLPENWQRLEHDIRKSTEVAEIQTSLKTIWGIRYEIETELATPSGRRLPVRIIWQVDTGTNEPRLITLYPS